MEVNVYIPHPALREFVLSIATVKAVLPRGIAEVVNPYPPTPFQSLLFYNQHPVGMSRNDNGTFDPQPLTVLTGPQFSRVNIKVSGQLNAVRVDFLPGGLYRLLGVPMNKLFDEGYDAAHFFGPGIHSINSQLQDTDDPDLSKDIVEAFLLARISSQRDILPFDHAMQALLKNNGAMSVEKTASIACLSIKQFERKCLERIGMTPKTYARVLRFSRAYRLHEACPHLSWTRIAHEAAYYDQMHMIRDFKVFAGVNPSVIEQQLRSTPLRMQKDIIY